MATVHYVSKNGNNIPPYLSWEDAANTIQSAIDEAGVNDTILIDEGLYSEKLRLSSSIVILGVNQESVIISGEGVTDTTIYTTSDLIIRNLTVSRGKFGIWLDDATLKVSDCSFSHHYASIRVSQANTTIQNCYSDTDNTFLSLLNNEYTGKTVLEKCILYGKKGKSVTVIISPVNNNLKISNNIFYGNWISYILYSPYCNNVQINNNLVFNERLLSGILIDSVDDSLSIKSNMT